MPVSVIENASFGNSGIVTANGIKFPATQVASADANTLDDYEEGTWTPNIGGTATYGDARYGIYTKIGNVVACQFRIQIITRGTGSLTTLSGLPFTTGTTAVQSGCVSYYDSLAVNTIFLSFYSESNATTCQFVAQSTSKATVDNAIQLFGNGTIIHGSITYRVG